MASLSFVPGTPGHYGNTQIAHLNLYQPWVITGYQCTVIVLSESVICDHAGLHSALYIIRLFAFTFTDRARCLLAF